MKIRCIFTCSLFWLLTFISIPSFSISRLPQGEQNDKEQTILREWKAGKKVSQKSVTQFGTVNCFKIQKIDDTLFKRIYGKSYKQNSTIPKEELRYLKVLHYNLKEEICLGELVCNKAISNDLIEIFQALYKARYPIERMVLIDEYDAEDNRSMQANNSSCFNFRYVPGTRKLSNHSKGLAIDINPLYNPYVRTNKNGKVIISPENGKKYADRSQSFPYKIDKNDLCYKEFIKRGFIWGGAWKSLKDYQHFEKSR